MKLQKLRMILKSHQYPKMVVEIGIEKSLATPQEQLRSKKLKNSDDFTKVFISTYNPNNPIVFPKVRKSPNLKMFAKRQPSNLKRLLCSSTFLTNKLTFKITKCAKSCFCCDYITEGELFKFKNWHQTFPKSNLNCETPNLYIVHCLQRWQ